MWRRNHGEATLCSYRIDCCVVDLAQRGRSELTYDGLHAHEINGVAFHGDPDGAPGACGNVFTRITNAQALAETERRRRCLERCLGPQNITALTDRQVEALLAADPTAARESR